MTSPCVLDAWISRECDGPEALPLPDRVRATQLRLLRQTLAWAATRSRFYKRTLAGCDLQLRSLADLARLPFTTVEDLRRWQNFLCISQSDVQRIVTLQTSGSTGLPKRLAFSEHDLKRTALFFAVGMRQLIEPGQSLLVLLPGADRPDGVTDLLRQALSPAGIRVEGGNPAATPDSLRDDFARVRPDTVIGGPEQLEALLHAAAQDATLHAAACRLRGALSSGGVFRPELQENISTAFSCLTLDHYGLTESGFGGGVQCPAREGHHLRELDCLIEIIDPVTGAPLPEGQVGELVLTTLQREAMPLVRYRTGDAASLLPGPCACGSPLHRLGPVLGRYVREGDTIVLRAVPKGAGSGVEGGRGTL